MKIKIPYNIFIFIWALFGIVIYVYGLFKDFITDGFANNTRLELIIDLNILIFLVLYVIKYLKHRSESQSIT